MYVRTRNRCSRARFRRRLIMEGLEHRLPLAGNVTAALAGGALTLTGNGASNALVVSFDDASDEYTVTGFNDTTINGDESQTFTGVTSISASLNGGNDIFAVLNNPEDFEDLLDRLPSRRKLRDLDLPAADPVPLSGTLNVLSGPGNDFVGLAVEAGGAVTVNTNSGNDAVGVLDSVIGGALAITTNSGSDGVLVARSEITGALSVMAGADVDLVAVDEVTAATGTIDLSLGGLSSNREEEARVRDSSFTGLLTMRGGMGWDKLKVESVDAGALTAEGGGGRDTFEVKDATIVGAAMITGGEGNDKVDVEELVAAALTINSAAGDDKVEIADGVIAGAVMVLTNAGNDKVEIEVLEAASLTVNTNGGNDQITIDGGSITGTATLIANAGNDKIEVNTLDVGGDLLIDAGEGNDKVEVGGRGGSGDDDEMMTTTIGEGASAAEVLATTTMTTTRRMTTTKAAARRQRRWRSGACSNCSWEPATTGPESLAYRLTTSPSTPTQGTIPLNWNAWRSWIS